MKLSLKFIPSFVCSLLLAGCVDFSGNVALTRPVSGPQHYSQDQPLTLLKPWEFRIVKCYWADELEKPGLRNLPPVLQERHRDSYIAKPQHRFLVVEMTERNLSNVPMSWQRINAPVLFLKNAKGARFTTTPNVAQNEMISVLFLQHPSLNPDEIVTAMEVFDVPKDEYTLQFNLGQNTGEGSYQANRVICEWDLMPTEGK